MTKLLEEIYYGEKGGYCSLVREMPECRTAAEKYRNSREAFEQELPVELRRDFRDCLSLCNAVGDEAEEAAFQFGIQFGIKLMWEVMRAR